MGDGQWFTVTELDESTYAISEYGHWENVHSYLLIGAKEAVLIDTGLGIGSMKTVTDSLTDLSVSVITTHVHWDHIGSHGEYQRIYVHEAEKDWLTDGIKGLPIEHIRRDVSRDITNLYRPAFPLKHTPRSEVNRRERCKTATQSAAIQGRSLFIIRPDTPRGISVSLIRRQATCLPATCCIPEPPSMHSTRRLIRSN